MTAYLIVCAVLVAVTLVIILLVGWADTWPLLLLVCLLVLPIVGLTMDTFYYERNAFSAITACEAQRMEAKRQVLSARVVCVPAYRATRNDSLTVSTPELRR